MYHDAKIRDEIEIEIGLRYNFAEKAKSRSPQIKIKERLFASLTLKQEDNSRESSISKH
jgi:hypothetical protein